MADNMIDADFLDAFGLTQDDIVKADDNPGDNTGADPDAQTNDDSQTDAGTPDVTNQGDASTEPNGQQQQQQQEPQQQQQQQQQQQPPAQNAEHVQRANAAFAQMRSENTVLKKLVNDIAGVLGVDANTSQNQMLAAVQNAVLNAQAKQQNIDPALLQRMSQLEAFKEQTERQALSSRALMGFQTVKNQFKLSDAELDNFADQLMQAGVNPFTKEVDLVSEYKLRNFDTLIAAAEQRGVAKEATRQTKVAAHSTQPGTAAGAGSSESSDKIKSVSELTNWFNNNSAAN